MNDLISVIIPVYNVEPYLENCVRSVMRQTYQNIEILLVDDGSTDQSGAICDRLSAEDPRIRVFHKPNGGVSSARNMGLMHTQGAYVSYVDADDSVSKHYIEYLYFLAKENGADISLCDLYQSDVQICDESHFDVSDSVECYSHSEAIQRGFSGLHTTYVVAAMYKTELALECLFPEDRSYGEDLITMAKLLYKANMLTAGRKKLYCYFQNPQSATHAKTVFVLEESLKANKVRAEWYESIGDAALARWAWNSAAMIALYNSTNYGAFLHCQKNELKWYIQDANKRKVLFRSMKAKIIAYLLAPRFYVFLKNHLHR